MPGPLTQLAAAVILGLAVVAVPAEPNNMSAWNIFITNDNCPDYTWGLTEEQTRRAFADIVAGHLDEMNRTDKEMPADRDRYNMAVTQEAMCFVERYPHRTQELITRIKQGRVYVSPFLCNSLWGFQSVEGLIRTLYPARRLEKQWGLPMTDVAEHIEQPSLPWGTATILAGCGIRWVSVPYLDYDCTFRGLQNPPLFILEGPDGSQLKVILDKWACEKGGYTQGAHLLKDTNSITNEWLPHYEGLERGYPLKAVLASGTHGDISPYSGRQARRFGEAIIRYNQQQAGHPTLVNATLTQFCEAVDAAQKEHPFLQKYSGSFGDSWDLWPVCLAKYAADMRHAERQFLTAEALLAVAAAREPDTADSTAEQRHHAEWCLAMLADHAWNGTDEANRRLNAQLRRNWANELKDSSLRLQHLAWQELGLNPGRNDVTIFNMLSIPRGGIVRLEQAGLVQATTPEGNAIPSQIVREQGRDVLYLESPQAPGFGFVRLKLKQGAATRPRLCDVSATEKYLESPYYKVTIDPEAGGITSVLYKPAGTELVAPDAKQRLCQTVYYDGNDRAMDKVVSEVVAEGPVLARVRLSGRVGDAAVENYVTVYAALDQLDFDVLIEKPVTTVEQRICNVFPIARGDSALRVESIGAVVRPRLQPDGDLLAGADMRRCAVQGFVDISSEKGPGVTIAPLDAFVLRLDLEPVTFEAIGNDQNYKEVVKDQDGVTRFQFRYLLRAHKDGYNNAEAIVWSRTASMPLLAVLGKAEAANTSRTPVEVDPGRAIATCLKPADEADSKGVVMRMWEVAGTTGPLEIPVRGYNRAVLTDLLERDLYKLPIIDGNIRVDLKAHGLAAVRLVP